MLAVASEDAPAAVPSPPVVAEPEEEAAAAAADGLNGSEGEEEGGVRKKYGSLSTIASGDLRSPTLAPQPFTEAVPTDKLASSSRNDSTGELAGELTGEPTSELAGEPATVQKLKLSEEEAAMNGAPEGELFTVDLLQSKDIMP